MDDIDRRLEASIRALLAAQPGVRDIEVRGAALEDAFLQLTTETPMEIAS